MSASAQGRTPPTRKEWAAFALAVLLVGCAHFWNLGRPLLWGDEAGTAVFARNVLRSGLPTAFDGRNLSIYDSGAELNEDLVVVKIPWVQYYVGALSLALFGDDTRGARSLFALAGVAACLPLWAVLRTRVPYALVVAVLLAISPQTLLFNRNARYYALITLLYAVLAWLVCKDGGSRKTRITLGTLCFVALFHTHPLAAATCGATVLLFQALRRSRSFFDYLLACGIGFGSWLAWFEHFGPTIVELPPFLGAFWSDPGALRLAGEQVAAGVLDLDMVNCVPLLAWGAVIVTVACTAPRRLLDLVREPLSGFVLLGLCVHLLVIGAGTEQMLESRYMPHLIAFAPIPLFRLLGSAVPRERWFLPLCAAIFATNLPTVSHWTKRGELPASWLPWSYAELGRVPVSWWPPTYAEILWPEPEAWDAVIEEVERSPTPVSGEATMTVSPPWMREIAIFYLGDRLICVPEIEPGSRAEKIALRALGYNKFVLYGRDPTWSVLFHAQGRANLPGYERIEIPVYRAWPDDGTRPELTRHAFRRRESLGMAFLYRRTN